VPSQLGAIVVVEAFDLSVLRGIGPLHQFLFLKTPVTLELREMVLDAVLVVGSIEDVVESVFVTGLVSEIAAGLLSPYISVATTLIVTV
jgi:hypothetical protein